VRVKVRTPYGRAVAVVAGAVIGLAGAVAFVAPASAAGSTPSAELTATSSCNGGAWKATFTLTTADTNGAVGDFSNVSIGFEASAYDIAHHMPPPVWPNFQNGKASGDGEFTEDWPLSRSFGSVLMKFTVTWHDGADIYTKNVSADVHAPTDCDWPPPPTPMATPSASSPSSPTQPGASASAAAAPALGEDTGGSGGGLPVTGAAAGTLAGAAALLLIVGAVLFVMSRRRRVKFTA
jgi:LPXTG-motif cell wall-anchored protein